MKKVTFVFSLVFSFVLLFAYASPVQACDCDPASALLWGMKDRLHQPWPNDPALRQEKEKNTKNTENAPKQEVQPSNQDMRSKGEIENR